ncbi:MAG: hypothetical protein E7356_02095 [Clostridiales bacterium]|nr:hypothetical protein [Clostridiales bacterium]
MSKYFKTKSPEDENNSNLLAEPTLPKNPVERFKSYIAGKRERDKRHQANHRRWYKRVADGQSGLSGAGKDDNPEMEV